MAILPLLPITFIAIVLIAILLSRPFGNKVFLLIPIGAVLMGPGLALAARGPALGIVPGPMLFRILAVNVGLILLVGVLILTRPQAKTRTKSGGKIAAIILLLLALLLVVRTQNIPSAIFPSKISMVDTGTPATPSIWQAGVDQRFRADIYPSEESAALGLGHAIGQFIQKQCPDLAAIAITPDDALVTRPTIDSVVKGLLQVTGPKQIQIRDIHHGSFSSVDNPQTGAILLSRYRDGRDDQTSNSTKLEARCHVPEHQPHTIKLSFVEKFWLTNLAQYLNEHPQEKHYVVYSTESSNTAVEAHQQALDQARQRVQRALSIDRPGLSVSVSAEDLEACGIVLDRFVQSLEGTVGKIWREALLLDMDPEKLRRLESIKLTHLRVRHHTWFQLAISVIGLGIVILILYIFLNAATRGYYTWALRVAAVVVAVAIIATIIIVRLPMV